MYRNEIGDRNGLRRLGALDKNKMRIHFKGDLVVKSIFLHSTMKIFFVQLEGPIKDNHFKPHILESLTKVCGG